MRILVLLTIFATLQSALGLKCGGTVEVGGAETVIEYLPPGGYEDLQFCVWTLVPTAAYSGLSIDYVSFGVENGVDGVTIYNWGEDGEIAATKLQPSDSNSTNSFAKPYAVIAFSSDVSITGQGFQVTIRGTGHLEGHFNYRGFVLNQTHGNFSYPDDFGVRNYGPNERVTVVVDYNVAVRNEVTIDFTDIEDDPLKVYRLYPLYFSSGSFRLIGMTNGSNPEGVPSLTSRDSYPRLLLFHSNDNSKTGKGFSISWSP